jgi:hypothetical protein
MQPSHFHQELARTRHAEHVRGAIRRAELPREELATVVEPRRPRIRLIRPRLALRLVPG